MIKKEQLSKGRTPALGQEAQSWVDVLFWLSYANPVL